MSRRTRTGPRDEVVPALAGMRNYYSAVQKLRAFVLYEFYASYGVILFVFPGARCVCRVNFSPFFLYSSSRIRIFLSSCYLQCEYFKKKFKASFDVL